ncbi:MAG: hypothetical protein AAF944_27765 [Bacteroidota bacterium]
MRTIIAKTVKLSFAFAILGATLFSCSEDVINPDESMTIPKNKIKVPGA